MPTIFLTFSLYLIGLIYLPADLESILVFLFLVLFCLISLFLTKLLHTSFTTYIQTTFEYSLLIISAKLEAMSKLSHFVFTWYSFTFNLITKFLNIYSTQLLFLLVRLARNLNINYNIISSHFFINHYCAILISLKAITHIIPVIEYVKK